MKIRCGEIGCFEDAMHEGADLKTNRHLAQGGRRREQSPVLGSLCGLWAGRRRLVVDNRFLWLARDQLVAPRGDVAV